MRDDRSQIVRILKFSNNSNDKARRIAETLALFFFLYKTLQGHSMFLLAPILSDILTRCQPSVTRKNVNNKSCVFIKIYDCSLLHEINCSSRIFLVAKSLKIPAMHENSSTCTTNASVRLILTVNV